MWRQKSREVWLREGDKKTWFFHSCTIDKRKRNGINKPKNSEGTGLPGRNETGTYRNMH